MKSRTFILLLITAVAIIAAMLMAMVVVQQSESQPPPNTQSHTINEAQTATQIYQSTRFWIAIDCSRSCSATFFPGADHNSCQLACVESTLAR